MGKQSYGTAIGGYVSIIARYTILALAIGQIWACFYEVKNYEMTLESQLSVPNDVVYEMTYEKGFPSFSIYTATEGKITDPSQLKGKYNDEEKFKFYFTVGDRSDDVKVTEVGAI